MHDTYLGADTSTGTDTLCVPRVGPPRAPSPPPQAFASSKSKKPFAPKSPKVNDDWLFGDEPNFNF